MAKDKKKDEPAEGGGPSKLPIILGISNTVLILVVGGLSVMNMLKKPEAAVSSAQVTETAANVDLPTAAAGTYTFDPFVVNLMDSANIRFVKVQLELELSSTDMIAELDERKPQLQDMVISVLSNRTYAELLGVRGKTQVREELLRRMNQSLTTGTVTRIYFTEFLVQ